VRRREERKQKNEKKAKNHKNTKTYVDKKSIRKDIRQAQKKNPLKLKRKIQVNKKSGLVV